MDDSSLVASKITIDFNRVLNRFLKYWYIFIISIFIVVIFSIIKNRYSVSTYPVTASIVFKESKESKGESFIYNNSLVSGVRNYLNETYIIKSFPLIERTLREINFGISFFVEGNVLTTEVYNLPIECVIINDNENATASFKFKMINSNQYELSTSGDGKQLKDVTLFHFKDTITYHGLSLLFAPKPLRDHSSETDVTYLVNYTSPSLLAPIYAARLSAAWAEVNAGIMNLSIEGNNPEKEIDFLTGLILNYQNYDLDKKNQTAIRTSKFIMSQLASISDSLHKIEAKLELFKTKNIKSTMGSEVAYLSAKIDPLEGINSELGLREIYFNYLTDYLNRNENYDQIILPTSTGITDGLLNSLMSRLIDLQLLLKMNDKPDNPLVVQSKKNITEIKKEILESVKNLRSTDKIRKSYVNDQISLLDTKLNKIPLVERELISIKRNYSLLENQYIFLLQKQAEANISKASTASDISVVNPPMISGGPRSSSSINYYLAAFIGLILPALFFVVIEFLNDKVQSREDIEKITNIPFIGGVGHKNSKNNIDVLTSPKSGIAESFRALRSNLSYFLGTHEKAVFMITSSISGEGKSFSSVNLASIFALSGKKTLIVGADMRKPKIFSDFSLSNNFGLSNYLAGISDFDSLIQKTFHESLDVISAGQVPPNPSELLMSDRMRLFMDEARNRYDYVIIDTPPIAIVTDALGIIKFVDHTLFVVRQNYTKKILLKSIDDLYVKGLIKKVSIVMNDIHMTGIGYETGYGYGYESGGNKNGYGYYTE